MNKKNFFSLSLTLSSILILTALLLPVSRDGMSIFAEMFRGSASLENKLALNENNKCSSAECTSKNVIRNTAKGNPISLELSSGNSSVESTSGNAFCGFTANNNGWVANTTKLNGINSITLTVNDSAATFRMDFGESQSLNTDSDDDGLYSTTDLTGRTSYTFKVDEYYKYFRFKNVGSTDVELVSIEISYSCEQVFLPKLVYAGDEKTIESGYTYEVTSGNAARVSGNKLLFEKPGNVTIKVSNGSSEFSYTRTVIDFGNITGEATDLATVLDAWGYGNKIGDNNVSISYVSNITDAYNSGTVTMNALDYSRPSNTGENRDRTNNMLFLNPSLVTKAIKAGYSHISFYAYIPRVNDGLNSTSFGLFNSNSIGGLQGANNAIGTSGNNGDTWRYQSISLSSLKSGYGVGFVLQAKHLYLTNVRFYGADISSVTSSYFQTAKTDRSKDLINQSLIGKMYSTVSNYESLTYNNTGSSYESDNDGNDYINFARTGISQTVINTPFNGVIISADWLKAAKKAGYVGLAVYFKLPSGATTEGANLFRMRVGNTTLGAYNAAQTGFVNFTISSVADGESIIIGFKGARLTLSGMTFRTTGPSPATGWGAANVINNGNLALANS